MSEDTAWYDEIDGMVLSLNKMLSETEPAESKTGEDIGHKTDALLKKCATLRRPSFKLDLSATRLNTGGEIGNVSDPSTRFLDIIGGLTSRSALKVGGNDLEHHSTSADQDNDEGPLSDSDDDYLLDDDLDENDTQVENQRISNNTYEYDEWYDRIDDLEIDFDEDPAYKKYV